MRRCLALCLVPVLSMVACSSDPNSDPAGPDGAGEVSVDALPVDSTGDIGPGHDNAPDIVDLTPGLKIDYDANTGVSPRYQPNGAGWTATPWPNDRHRSSDGTLDLTNFPNPDNIDLLVQYLAMGTEVLDGWGLNGSVYFEFDGPLSVEDLPDAATTKNNRKAIIQLVNVTQGSTRYGEQMPLLFHFYESGNDIYYASNTLAMRAVFGFPLAEGETYCALVTRAVTDSNGRYLSRPSAFADALANDPSLAPLNAWLPDSLLLAEDIAAATCLTTQTATRELRKIREYLDTVPVPDIAEIVYEGATKKFFEFQGTYLAPNFQSGTKPYDTEGGDIVFDDAGEPIVQSLESVRWLLMIPTAYSKPAGGWPVVLYAHGTGGDYQSCKGIAEYIMNQGLAMICIDQPLHGIRSWVDEPSMLELVLYSFNFLNPRSGRSGFRQSAIDTMSLARMVSNSVFEIAAGSTGFEHEVELDPGSIFFFGHSHGGLSGALVFGIDPLIRAGVLSGAGGILIQTILLRKDMVDIEVLVQNALGVSDEQFNSHHPLLTMIQMLIDATDPINYAPYWLNPKPGGLAKHVFVTEGEQDEATPYLCTDAMAGAAGIPLIEPVSHDSIPHLLAGLKTYELPVAHNVTTAAGEKRTAGLRQWKNGNHWVALESAEAIDLWSSFFRALRKGSAPVIK